MMFEKIYSGKVRDLYDLGRGRLLMVASDRLSAFDVILDDPVPQKGVLLTKISQFWFDRFADIMPNHLTGESVADVVPSDRLPEFEGRSMVVRRLTPVRIEAVVRGYLAGGGWQEYRQKGTVCGHKLPENLKQAQKLPEPIFTPSTKAEVGEHDENITFVECERLIGKELAQAVRDSALKLYRAAADYALTRGIIIADTKFEFGLDDDGRLVLMDEVLTPDSSRFWPAESYRAGENPPSFDKQFVRDWLNDSGWNKQPPAPRVPLEVLRKTADKYQEAFERLTGTA